MSSVEKRSSPTVAPVKWILSQIPYKHEVILFFIAAMVRFYRLSEPGAVVFDESHFGKFTAHYQRGSYVFDIHPPLGKMTFAFLGSLLGYDSKLCAYDDIGSVYPRHCQFYLLRAISATFGSLLPPLAFKIAKILGATNRGAFLAGLFVVFDGLNTIESRLVLMDAQLMWWAALSIYVGLKFFQRFDPEDGSAPLTDKQCLPWYVAIGITCGLAISIKWTSLVSPGMVAIESTFGIWFLKRRRVPFTGLLTIAGVVIATYVTVFWFHFAALPKTGDRASAFVPVEFSVPYEKTLLNHPEYEMSEKMPFWYTFPMANYEMFLVNSKITQPHHWGSRFNQWVVNARGVAYWGGSVEPTGFIEPKLRRSIYLNGNPIVIWGCLAGIFTYIVVALLYLRYRKWLPTSFREPLGLAVKNCSFCLVAWVCNLAPYMAVARSSFAYHYMPALLQAEILTAILIDRLFGEQLGRYAINFAAAASIICFLYFSPWVYALPLEDQGVANRRWMPTWD